MKHVSNVPAYQCLRECLVVNRKRIAHFISLLESRKREMHGLTFAGRIRPVPWCFPDLPVQSDSGASDRP